MKHFVPLLALAATMISAAPCHAASVILECIQVDNKGEPVDPDRARIRHLLEINYDARAVRAHLVTADGAPVTIQGYATPDTTSPAQIGENEIKWGNPSASYFALGRYSGTLTEQTLFAGNVGWRTMLSRCQPYAAPKRQKKF